MSAAPQADEAELVFRALADESRRRLLDRLNQRNGQSLRELCFGLEMTRQSVSKHLDILATANLVTTVRSGREKLHYLNPVPINEIAERWITQYDRERVRALADLKHTLEDTPMSQSGQPAFVYTTYIKTTPERLWQALTQPAFMLRWWEQSITTDWQVGSPMTWERKGVSIANSEQVVLEADPYRRLAYTWHTFTPELARVNNFSDEMMDRVTKERRSRVSFELEPVGEVVRLTVMHDNLDPAGVVAGMVSKGWPPLLSSLKSLLETGEPLAISSATTPEVRRGLPQ